jgi:hypothetical protein
MGRPKCVGPLGERPAQTVKGGGHGSKPVRGPTQTDQNRRDLGLKYVGLLEMP